MNLDLRELYQEIIIDHNREPRNHHAMDDATTTANGFNPVCGDKLTVYAKIEDNKISDLSFVGCGCAISQASASLMTEELKGKSLEEAHAIFHKFHNMLTIEGAPDMGSMDKLTVLAGVKAFPMRVKCATLAWHTMEAALNKDKHEISTE